MRRIGNHVKVTINQFPTKLWHTCQTHEEERKREKKKREDTTEKKENETVHARTHACTQLSGTRTQKKEKTNRHKKQKELELVKEN